MTPGAVACRDLLRAHAANPFLVLELPVTATALEVERQGAKLLAMLAAGVAGADRYRGPCGVAVRTAELVRQAMAEARDPRRRLLHEWWVADWEGKIDRAPKDD